MEINYLHQKRGGWIFTASTSSPLEAELSELITLGRDFSPSHESRRGKGNSRVAPPWLPRFSEFLVARGSGAPVELPASGSVGNFYAAAERLEGEGGR